MSQSARKLPDIDGPSPDALVMSAFLNGAAHVLKLQASTLSQAEKPYLRTKETPAYGDIAGVIDVHSDLFLGLFAIRFPAPTFLTIMSKMLGETFTTLTPDIHDGAAELTNIIFGQAKVTLNERGDNLKMARPLVVIGLQPPEIVTPLEKSFSIIVPFTSDSGPFQIEIKKSSDR